MAILNDGEVVCIKEINYFCLNNKYKYQFVKIDTEYQSGDIYYYRVFGDWCKDGYEIFLAKEFDEHFTIIEVWQGLPVNALMSPTSKNKFPQ